MMKSKTGGWLCFSFDIQRFDTRLPLGLYLTPRAIPQPPGSATASVAVMLWSMTLRMACRMPVTMRVSPGAPTVK